jgi:SAM-dependent methyltransferase
MNQDKMWEYFQTQGLEKFSSSVPRLRFLIKQAKRIARGRGIKVLNIGVGDGWLEKRCLEQGWETFALDPAEKAFDNLTRLGVQARMGHIEEAPFSSESFDVVFCSEVIEHLGDDQLNRGLREIQRILKPGGVLLGTVPFEENLVSGRVVCPACGNVFHGLGHQQSFNLQRLAEVFAGLLKVERMQAIYFFDWGSLNLKGKIIAILKKLLALAGVHGTNENIFFVTRKIIRG